MATRTELYNSFKGKDKNNNTLPIRINQTVVRDLKTFLLGDGHQDKIRFVAEDSKNQEALNLLLNESDLYRKVFEMYDDTLILGDGYLDMYVAQKPRHIVGTNVKKVEIDPEDPTQIVYMEETRKSYNPTTNAYEEFTVLHYLSREDEPSDDESPFDLSAYRYTIDSPELPEPFVTSLEKLPIVRVINKSVGGETISELDGLIDLQLEYNENHVSIHQNGRHHKPIPYSIGTSGPQTMPTSNATRADAVTDAYPFQTVYADTSNIMLHFPVSKVCEEMGQLPQIAYLQPQDSNYLERQRLIIIQEIYNLTGTMILELQNARSASSASSLSILYEPLKRATAQRAQYLIPALKKILIMMGVEYPVSILLPDMIPLGVDDDKIRIEEVAKRMMSRKQFLIKYKGYTEVQALAEIEQLYTERALNIQYSAAIVEEEDNLQEKVK